VQISNLFLPPEVYDVRGRICPIKATNLRSQGAVWPVPVSCACQTAAIQIPGKKVGRSSGTLPSSISIRPTSVKFPGWYSWFAPMIGSSDWVGRQPDEALNPVFYGDTAWDQGTLQGPRNQGTVLRLMRPKRFRWTMRERMAWENSDRNE